MVTENMFSTVSSGVVALAGLALIVWIYRRFMPVLELRILPRWAGESTGLLVLRLEVQNKSKVGLKRDPTQLNQVARFQILEHAIPETGLLSGWVPFDEKDILSNESPIQWHEPVEILKTTEKIEPGETVAVELLYRVTHPAALHCAFQFRAELNIVAALAYRQRWDSWTTTIWITRTENVQRAL